MRCGASAAVLPAAVVFGAYASGRYTLAGPNYGRTAGTAGASGASRSIGLGAAARAGSDPGRVGALEAGRSGRPAAT